MAGVVGSGSARGVRLNARTRWLIWIVICAVILLVFWNTALVRPLRIFAVFFHEISHALVALLTGGGVTYIEVTSYEAGRTAVYGGLAILVYSAGYIGTALVGAAFLVSGLSFPAKRILYLALAIVALLGTVLFMRNGFGWAYGIISAGFLMLLFFNEFRYSDKITDILGISCILYSLYDFGDFLRMDNRNDALILQEKTGIPYPGIVVTWLLLSILIIGFAIFLRARGIAIIDKDKALRREDFRLRIRKNEVSQKPGNPLIKSKRWTLFAYFGAIALIVVAFLWVSRFVLFQPWSARDWVTGVEAENAVYIVGGRDRHGQVFDEIYKIQPEKKSLRTVAELPTPRYGVGVAAIGEMIYILGGYDGRECFGEVIRYNVTNGAFDSSIRMPGSMAFGGAARIGNSIYYVGGWDGSKALDEMWEYSTEDGAFRMIGRLPSPRELITTVSANGFLYVIGGSDDRGKYLNEVLEIDVATGELRRTAILPYEIKRTAAAVLEKDLIIAGGWEGLKSERVTSVDLDELSIIQLPDLPRGFSDHAFLFHGEEFYLFGSSHRQFKRQLGCLKLDPYTGKSEDVKFRSFLFW